MAGFDEYTRQMRQINASIQKMCEPFGNMANYLDFANNMQAQLNRVYQVPDGILAIQRQQESFINMFASITAVNRQMEMFQNVDFSALTSAISALGNLDGIMSVVKNFSASLPNYNFDALSRITQEAFNRLDHSVEFNMDSFADEIVEQYEQEEVPENKTLEENVNVVSKEQRIKDVRDWLSFLFSFIGLLLTIYSSVSTKPAVTYNNVTEINNYYTIDKDFDADCLNALSYRIISDNNVMPRIKPDCSSQVTGHLNIGQIVIVLEKHKKWVLVSWENEAGEEITGWIQNYKMTEFK